MVSNDHIETAARRLREADMKKEVCLPVRDLIGIKDLEAAYAVQRLNTQLRVDFGAKVVGHKIGLTAAVVQEQLGVDQPDFGLLWDDKEVSNGGSISVSELMQPKAEAEIAFVLGKELDSAQLREETLLDAIDYALASIEIVGSRIENWNIKITDTIADNASASHWVIGTQQVNPKELDLVNCQMTMMKNGKIVSEGKGKNCLGSPLNALEWLAKKMAGIGEPLKKGDLILTGALGPMVPINAGDHFEASIEGLGAVNVTFTN
ncbi:MAG: fumarylacetoacetate hydrolase family protein [Flavobacteriaceae bacterium]|nr:fumarylacetoacetate hydrolase family protein [Flavobacteriaceae bacterium]